jgi:hypothetical protein
VQELGKKRNKGTSIQYSMLKANRIVRWWGGEWERGRRCIYIHIKQAVVDKQLLELKGNLDGDMIRNLCVLFKK